MLERLRLVFKPEVPFQSLEFAMNAQKTLKKFSTKNMHKFKIRLNFAKENISSLRVVSQRKTTKKSITIRH